MQIKITDAEFGFNGETLFEHLSLEVNTHDKIAIIGRNGSGKTTLLKILQGKIELHQPENALPVYAVSGSPVIYELSQMTFEDESRTLYSEILTCYSEILNLQSKLDALQRRLETEPTDELVEQYSRVHDNFERLGGYEYKAEIDETLSNFGLLADADRPLSQFSGGQKTKIAFVKLILSKPDILLLDEPTNHLDIRAVSFLESYISAYKKAVVIVSHDRAFLDNTVGICYELEHKRLTKYIGNYTKFLETKAANYEANLKAYEAQQREIADINAFIERFRYKATKASAVQSRIKMLEKMEIIPKPEMADNRSFKSKFKPNIQSGTEVLSVTNLKIGYSKDKVLSTVDFKLMRGERLGIIGGNGLGKSTLLKVLTEKIPPISGHFKFGFNVEYGYFEQTQTKPTSSKTVLEDFMESFPDLNSTEARSALGSFLFSGKDVLKPLSSLSGGELVRLGLLKILEKHPNLLILDEPTNHMDITGKETLESMLLGFEGTIIFVSHDRYFVSKVASKLLIFDDGKATYFDGTYKEYTDPYSKTRLETQENRIPEQKKEKIEYPEDYDDNPAEPEKLSPYFLAKEKNRLTSRQKKIEENSKAAEERIKQLSADFINPEIASDFKKLMEIQGEMEKNQILVDSLAEEWLEVSEKLAALEAQDSGEAE